MNRVFTYTFLSLLSVLFVFNAAASAQALKIEFPEVTGWKKGEITKYPVASLGYSIGYESEKAGWVDIYVYDAGNKSIAASLDDKTVKAQFAQAKSDIFEVGKQGAYKNIKEIRSSTVTLGGTGGKVRSLYSLFNMTARDEDLTSEIYLFSYKNNFIKIRSSRPREADGFVNKDVAALLASIDAVFSK